MVNDNNMWNIGRDKESECKLKLLVVIILGVSFNIYDIVICKL